MTLNRQVASGELPPPPNFILQQTFLLNLQIENKIIMELAPHCFGSMYRKKIEVKIRYVEINSEMEVIGIRTPK